MALPQATFLLYKVNTQRKISRDFQAVLIFTYWDELQYILFTVSFCDLIFLHFVLALVLNEFNLYAVLFHFQCSFLWCFVQLFNYQCIANFVELLNWQKSKVRWILECPKIQIFYRKYSYFLAANILEFFEIFPDFLFMFGNFFFHFCGNSIENTTKHWRWR